MRFQTLVLSGFRPWSDSDINRVLDYLDTNNPAHVLLVSKNDNCSSRAGGGEVKTESGTFGQNMTAFHCRWQPVIHR